MKRAFIYMPAVVVAFSLGVGAVSVFWGPLTVHIQSPSDGAETDASDTPARPVTTIRTQTFDVSPTTPEKKPNKRRVPIKRHECFEGVTSTLKRLAAFMGATGEQTFYISDVETYDGGEFARAYWKQKNAVVGLHLPVFGEPTEPELYWLSDKAYTDLDKDVVPKELNNMGCCLVTKAWADRAVRECKAGYKLKFSIDARAE